MAKIEHLNALVAKLRARAARGKKDDGASVSVGFTAAYAIYVHENLEAHHPIGQAKFLEQPARQNQDKYRGIINDAMRKKLNLAQALLLAGMSLQRDAQLLVPIDTGNLKNSAFTRLNAS